jgi:hypothetical protein
MKDAKRIGRMKREPERNEDCRRTGRITCLTGTLAVANHLSRQGSTGEKRDGCSNWSKRRSSGRDEMVGRGGVEEGGGGSPCKQTVTLEFLGSISTSSAYQAYLSSSSDFFFPFPLVQFF